LVYVSLVPKDATKPISIPRGESWAQLTEVGLTGKIAINSLWQELDVKCEVSNWLVTHHLVWQKGKFCLMSI
jgi:hypothetical protein